MAVTLVVLVVLLGVGAVAWTRARRQGGAATATALVPATYTRVDPDARPAPPTPDAPLRGPVPQGFQDAFDALGMKPAARLGESALVLLTALDRVDQTLGRVPLRAGQAVHGLLGSDVLACKARLALTLEAYAAGASAAGDRRALLESLLPRTYVLLRVEDRGRLEAALQQQEADPKTVWILKKNVQRQQGHLLTRDPAAVRTAMAAAAAGGDLQGYVVAQEVLQDPYLIRGRKINLRVYVLVVGRPSTKTLDFYVFDDGFLYYTPEPWEAGSTDPKRVVTTGYIDRRVYDENPLSHRDLARELGPAAYGTLQAGIRRLFGHVAAAFRARLLAENAPLLDAGVTPFLVYGCDVAPSAADVGTVRLMEINKGPDLSYKDERDRAVKFRMLVEMLGLVGVLGVEGDVTAALVGKAGDGRFQRI
jgi:hypothetical protein